MSNSPSQPITNPSLEQAQTLSPGDEVVIVNGYLRDETVVRAIVDEAGPSVKLVLEDDHGTENFYRITDSYSRYWT
jgi:C-terminal processing protease CtpA/Prc